MAYWLDDGSACTAEEMLEMVYDNLEYLDKDDPAYGEQIDLYLQLMEDIHRREK